MSDVVLTVEVRDQTGKSGARSARREGRIPGVIYGGEQGSIPIAFQRNEVLKVFRTGHLLSRMIEIDHDGSRQPVIARDVQFHPVTDEPLHIDVYRVTEKTRIDVDVPVHFINSEASPGLKRGGVLNVVRHDVNVNCPAGAIPEELVADLTGLTIGDSVHISDIALPEGVKPTVTDRDFTIATIAGRMAEMSEEDEAAPEADEVPATAQSDEEDGEGEEGDAED